MRDSPSVVVSTDETEASAEDYRVMMRFEERTCPYFVLGGLGGFSAFFVYYVFDIIIMTPRARFTSMYVVDVRRQARYRWQKLRGQFCHVEVISVRRSAPLPAPTKH